MKTHHRLTVRTGLFVLLFAVFTTAPASSAIPNLSSTQWHFENSTDTLTINFENTSTGTFTGYFNNTKPMSGTVHGDNTIQFNVFVSATLRISYSGAVQVSASGLRMAGQRGQTNMYPIYYAPFCAFGTPIPR